MAAKTRPCPKCGEPVRPRAARCRNCGETNERMRKAAGGLGEAFGRGNFGVLDLLPGVRDLDRGTKYIIVWVTLALVTAVIVYLFLGPR